MEKNQSKSKCLDNNSKAIILYFILTYIFNYLLGITIIFLKSDFLYAYQGYICMYGPGIAALIAHRINREQFPQLGFKICPVRYLIGGTAIPIFYLLVSHGIYWILFPDNLNLNVHFPKTLPMMIPIHIFFALGEEIGWRGFLAPSMTAKFGYVKASILIGIIWGLWHNPFFIERFYYLGAPFLFITMTVALSIILNYLRFKSKSIWPAVVIHGIHNFILFDILDLFTGGTQKVYFVGETGIITVGITILIALVFLLIYKNSPIRFSA